MAPPTFSPCFGGLRYVAPPVPGPLSFGLFSVSTMVPAGEDHWQMGVQWEPVACGPNGIVSDCTCNVPGTAKTYRTGTDLVIATPFTVYGSFSCSPIGRLDDAFARARAHLLAGEERAVELAIATQTTHTSQALNSTTTVDITPTPGTPVTVAQGTALLEQQIGSSSSGQGVILAARRDVLLAHRDHVLVAPRQGDNVLYTKLLTPVAALAGFDGKHGPSDTAAATGTSWMFATGGRPIIRRSAEPIMVTQQIADSLDRSVNNLRILAERTYTVGWDCGTYAVLVTSV